MHTVASPAPVAKVPNPGWKDRAFTGKARSSPLGIFCRWHCGWCEKRVGGFVCAGVGVGEGVGGVEKEGGKALVWLLGLSLTPPSHSGQHQGQASHRM